MQYNLKELADYDRFIEIYEKAKAIYNTNRIKYNCYIASNNEYMGTYVIEIPFSDYYDVYTQLWEMYIYNDIEIIVNIDYY